MSRRARLLSAAVHYGEGFVLHTALSGPVAALEELYLLIEDDGRPVALGEIRENVEYLSGLSTHHVRRHLLDALERLDWAAVQAGDHAPLALAAATLPPLPATLLECTAMDMAARASGLPLAEHLGGHFATAVETNQCLQLTTHVPLIETAERYVARGYRQLKLRVGGGAFEHDLDRLNALRGRFDSGITLAVDVNGAWSSQQALRYLPQLEPYRLSYIEQPVPADDCDGLAEAIACAPAPVMLDEAAGSLDAVRRIIASELDVLVHLKLPKIGGIAALLDAAQLLNDHGIPFMIGQMNEGGAATAAAVHCTMAARPRFAELYGADGLIDDPVKGVLYRDGSVEVPDAPGLGVTFDAALCTCLWEKQL